MEYVLLLINMSCFVSGVLGAYSEKSSTACNGPCGQMSLTCPAGHKMAIRDALYRVQYRSLGTVLECGTQPGCSDVTQNACCERKPEDCVFPFNLTEMQILQGKCSFKPSCSLKTSYPKLQSSQCASIKLQNFSSYTVLNYLCINGSYVSDMCSVQETVLTGKTLFSLVDPAAAKNLADGSVCTCKAQSVKWSATDTITAFVVDMRMTKVNLDACSDSTLSFRSGNANINLDCNTTRAPSVSYPFMSIVNETSVIHVKFQFQRSLPELIWIGFESNANTSQDIRLTCQLESKTIAADPKVDNPLLKDSQKQTNGKNEDKRVILIPAIIGSIVGGIVLTVIILVIVLVCKKKLQFPGSNKPLADVQNTQVDFDSYYSTPHEELKKLEAVMSSSERNSVSSARNSTSSAQDLYISPEDVRANKKRNSKSHSEVSIKDFEDEDEYVTTFEIQHRKRMSRLNKNNPGTGIIPPQEVAAENNQYDRLDGGNRRPSNEIMDSYDRLSPEEKLGKVGPRDGVFNAAYEDSDILANSLKIPVDSSPVNTKVYDNPAYNDAEAIVTPSISREMQGPSSSPTYDVPRRHYENEQASLQSHDSTVDETEAAGISYPVAAPRRKRKSLAHGYDIAKPIE